MFFGRRSFFGNPFKWILMLLGIKMILRDRLTDAEREEYKAKAKVFRTKVREACAVWDDDNIAGSTVTQEEQA